MAIAGKIALLATLRAVLGDPHSTGATATRDAVSFPVLASPSAVLLFHSRGHSAAARSPMAVARFGWGKTRFGCASKGSGAGADADGADAMQLALTPGGAGMGSADAPSDAANSGRDEALRAAKIVVFFLFIQKALYLREQKVSNITRKILLLVLICLSVWVGFMAMKGADWAVVLAGTADKADKIFKIVTAITTVLK